MALGRKFTEAFQNRRKEFWRGIPRYEGVGTKCTYPTATTTSRTCAVVIPGSVKEGDTLPPPFPSAWAPSQGERKNQKPRRTRRGFWSTGNSQSLKRTVLYALLRRIPFAVVKPEFRRGRQTY